MTRYYATYDDSFIYGTGYSPEEADAEYRAGIGDDALIAFLPTVDTVEMTEVLFLKVKSHGGDVPFRLNADGFICAEEEVQ